MERTYLEGAGKGLLAPTDSEELRVTMKELNDHFGLRTKLTTAPPKRMSGAGVTREEWRTGDYLENAEYRWRTNTIRITPDFYSITLLAHEFAHALEYYRTGEPPSEVWVNGQQGEAHRGSFRQCLEEVSEFLGIHVPTADEQAARHWAIY